MSKANTLQVLNLSDYVSQLDDSEQFGTFDLRSLLKAVIAGYDRACIVLEETFNSSK